MGLRVYVRVCDQNKTSKLQVLALHCIFRYDTFVLFIPILFQSSLSLSLLCHHGLLHLSVSLCMQDLG